MINKKPTTTNRGANEMKKANVVFLSKEFQTYPINSEEDNLAREAEIISEMWSELSF